MKGKAGKKKKKTDREGVKVPNSVGDISVDIYCIGFIIISTDAA